MQRVQMETKTMPELLNAEKAKLEANLGDVIDHYTKIAKIMLWPGVLL